MDEATDPTKILRVPEEFAKAKRNLLFWSAITLTVIAAHGFEPTNAQTFKLLVVDATIPFWFARSAAWALATFMLVGYLRALVRVDIINSQLARLHDSEDAEKIFEEGIDALRSIARAADNLHGLRSQFTTELEAWRSVKNSWEEDVDVILGQRLHRVREIFLPGGRASSEGPVPAAEKELRVMYNEIKTRVSLHVDKGDGVTTTAGAEATQFNSITTLATGLERRLNDLTAYSKGIANQDLAWLNWWDKRVPIMIYVLTMGAVFAASAR